MTSLVRLPQFASAGRIWPQMTDDHFRPHQWVHAAPIRGATKLPVDAFDSAGWRHRSGRWPSPLRSLALSYDSRGSESSSLRHPRIDVTGDTPARHVLRCVRIKMRHDAGTTIFARHCVLPRDTTIRCDMSLSCEPPPTLSMRFALPARWPEVDEQRLLARRFQWRRRWE